MNAIKNRIEEINLMIKKPNQDAEVKKLSIAFLSGIEEAKKILLNDEITWLISLNHDLKECDLTNIYPTEGYRLDEWIDKRITKLKQSLSSEEKT